MTAKQSATETQCPTAQQSVSSTAQQITTYTKLPNRVCPKVFVQHKSNFKLKSNTICPTLKSPPLFAVNQEPWTNLGEKHA